MPAIYHENDTSPRPYRWVTVHQYHTPNMARVFSCPRPGDEYYDLYSPTAQFSGCAGDPFYYPMGVRRYTGRTNDLTYACELSHQLPDD